MSDGTRNTVTGTVHGSAAQVRSLYGDLYLASGPYVRMPVPRQLPLAPGSFTNRAATLAALGQMIADQAPARQAPVIVITGVPGVGKTCLALHWLRQPRIRGDYPDGELFADLGGHQPETAALPGDVLGGFLRALGTQPDRVPADLAEMAGLWRSVTSGRRLLILLDNAVSAAQVRALLPGDGGSLVVVTSRWRIAGLAIDTRARFTELDPLDETAAVELLGSIAGAGRAATEPDAARSVARLCGGLPLAVVVAGARMAPHPRATLSRVAAELASEHGRLAALSLPGDLSVRAAFDVSYKALPAEATRAYRLTALIPGPGFSLGLAVAAIAADPGSTGVLLDLLTGASLLSEPAHGWFRFHDLVRLHAREQARADPTTEREAVMARSIDYYLETAVAADLVVHPHRWRLNPMYEHAREAPPAHDSPAQALRWLDGELPGLLAALRAAHEEGLHEQAWQLCEALWGLLTSRMLYQPWTDSHLIGLASAQACGDQRAEARMRVQLGLAYLHTARCDDARAEFTEALRLDREAGHRTGEATALEQLGLTDLAEGSHDAALALFTEALAIHEETGRTRGAAIMIKHIGEAHRNAGRFDEAAVHLLEARRLVAGLPDPYLEARALTSLAQARLDAGRADDAVEPLNEALAIMTGLDALYEQARIHAMLADCCARSGELADARSHLDQALYLYEELDIPDEDPACARARDLDMRLTLAEDTP